MRGRRYAGVVRLLYAMGILCVALGASFGAAPVAWASGPGPCASVTQSDLTQHAIAPQGHVTARLSRTQGTVGTLLTITGSGWPAGASVAVDSYTKRGDTLTSNGAMAQATASSAGSLTIGPFSAPLIGLCDSLNDNQDGGVALFLVHTHDGLRRVPITFTYLTYIFGPQISSATVVRAGSEITVTGAHWEAGEAVTITPMVAPWSPDTKPLPAFQPAPSAKVSGTADVLGSFSLAVPAFDEPALTEIKFVAQGTGPRYGEVQLVVFGPIVEPKALPRVQLDHTAVYPGGSLTVTGDGWAPDQAGVIEYCRVANTPPGTTRPYCNPPLSQELGTFHTDSNGHFVATIHLPTNAHFGPDIVQERLPSIPLAYYTQGQPLTIEATYAQLHPRLTRLIALAPYIGSALLLAALVALLIFTRRRRDGTQAGV